jgi:hypothetical protein
MVLLLPLLLVLLPNGPAVRLLKASLLPSMLLLLLSLLLLPSLQRICLRSLIPLLLLLLLLPPLLPLSLLELLLVTLLLAHGCCCCGLALDALQGFVVGPQALAVIPVRGCDLLHTYDLVQLLV